MLLKGIFNIRVDIGPDKFVIFHNPNVLVQYASLLEKGMDWTGEDSKIRPKIVRRGIAEIQEEIEQGKISEHNLYINVIRNEMLACRTYHQDENFIIPMHYIIVVNN